MKILHSPKPSLGPLEHTAHPRRTKKRLGAIGTFVWDVIHTRDTQHPPLEAWGGMTYSLAALDAALPDDWEIVPLFKVGADLAEEANTFWRTIQHAAPNCALNVVPSLNNRVTLRYHSDERRHEYLQGGVPPWQWDELAPYLIDVDALFVNFISGMEFDLTTAQRLRQHFDGLIYCDIHSLVLGVASDGLRTPRAVPNVEDWCRCFDIIQVNEDEVHLLAPNPSAFAALAISAGASLVHITLGPRGVLTYFAPHLDQTSVLDDQSSHISQSMSAESNEIRTSLTPAGTPRDPKQTDPTGCGDVWGATYFARLLAGDTVGHAATAATDAAVKNVNFRGTMGLAGYLQA